jgi:hypothetical protein
MPRHNTTSFACPTCGAEYKVVRVEAGPNFSGPPHFTQTKLPSGPPSLDSAEQALAKLTTITEELRREHGTRALSAENVGCLHALGFTLEQLRRNLEDFRNRVVECASREAR